jgi:hypothetical protein
VHVAYRTSRAFRHQFRVLELISDLEAAEEAAARPYRTKWAAGRAQRRSASAKEKLAVALSERSLLLVAPSDMLPKVRQYLEAEKAVPTPSARARRRGWVASAFLVVLCLLAWVTVLAEVATGGISNRLSLTVPDTLALVLTLATTLLLARRP